MFFAAARQHRQHTHKGPELWLQRLQPGAIGWERGDDNVCDSSLCSAPSVCRLTLQASAADSVGRVGHVDICVPQTVCAAAAPHRPWSWHPPWRCRPMATQTQRPAGLQPPPLPKPWSSINVSDGQLGRTVAVHLWRCHFSDARQCPSGCAQHLPPACTAAPEPYGRLIWAWGGIICPHRPWRGTACGA